MKFSCTQENMSHGLGVVSRIASRNVNLPILHNVLIQAQEDGIELITTNLEIGARVRVRGKVEETGTFTVPATIFSNYISLLSSERVDIKQEGDEILLKAATQKTKIKGDPATDFPLIPDVDQVQPLSVATDEFKEALSEVLVAVSHDDSRPELTGVYFSLSGSELSMAATDSYRLAERVLTVNSKRLEGLSVIIPSDALAELVRVLPEDGTVDVFVNDSQVLFKTKEIELTSRLIEGNFPDYKQIIPQDSRTSIIVEKQDFVKAIKSASLFSRSGIYDVNIHFSPENQAMTLSTVNNQVGENVIKLQAEITGDSNNTIFNYQYLLDGLSIISTSTVQLDLVDNVNPGVFRPTGSSKDSFVYVIMPIKQ